jgi:hypothetical protein
VLIRVAAAHAVFFDGYVPRPRASQLRYDRAGNLAVAQ